MSVCRWCEKDKIGSKTCNRDKIYYPNEKSFPAIKNETGVACSDCNVASGGYHHPGCHIEKCPRCRKRLVICGCLAEGIEE